MSWIGRTLNAITGVRAFAESEEAIPGHAAVAAGPVPSGRFALHPGGSQAYEAIPQSSAIRGLRLRVLYRQPDCDEEWIEGLATMIVRALDTPHFYLGVHELGHHGPRHLALEGISEIRDLRSGGRFPTLRAFARAHAIELPSADVVA